jgi:hypothetical protein
MAGLVGLFLRRALRPRSVVAFAVLALACSSVDWAPHADLTSLDRGMSEQALSRALTRQGVWTALWMVLAPWLVYGSARTSELWRAKGGGDWLASLPIHRGWITAAAFLGSGLAALAFLMAAGIAAEAASRFTSADSGGAGEGLWRWKRALTHSPIALADSAAHSILVADAPPEGALRIRILFLGGAGSARVRASLARTSDSSAASRFSPAGAAAAEAVERVVAAHCEIELALPRGSGDVELSIERMSGDAILLVPEGGIGLLAPARGALEASLGFYARAGSALLAWMALALGAGAWMSPLTATLLVGALWIPAWTGFFAAPWLPGSDLFQALSLLGQGIAPPVLGPGIVAGTAALVLLGVCACALGRWSSR